jgi:hypothetical protein
MVLLMAGEELVGAKQNRVLNVSLMVPAGEEMPVPVSCVEAGRWRYRARKFSSAGTSSHGKLRSKMSHYAHEAYRRVGRPSSRQGEVWEEVTDKLGKMGSRSPTAALHQVYEDYERQLREVSENTPVPEGCCGAVFACGGKIAGVDIFDRPLTLSKLWRKLLRSYAVDALELSSGESAEATSEADASSREDAPSLTAERVAHWLQQAAVAQGESYKSPGVGDDVRVKSDAITGGSLLVESHPVHTELFTALN